MNAKALQRAEKGEWARRIHAGRCPILMISLNMRNMTILSKPETGELTSGAEMADAQRRSRVQTDLFGK